MSESKRPCGLHAWQPVLLPDGRTAILCGKCGQHAVTLDAAPIAPVAPQPSTMPMPPNDGQTFIWPPMGGQELPRPIYEYFQARPQQVQTTWDTVHGYSLADTMSGTSAPGTGVHLS